MTRSYTLFHGHSLWKGAICLALGAIPFTLTATTIHIDTFGPATQSLTLSGGNGAIDGQSSASSIGGARVMHLVSGLAVTSSQINFGNSGILSVSGDTPDLRLLWDGGIDVTNSYSLGLDLSAVDRFRFIIRSAQADTIVQFRLFADQNNSVGALVPLTVGPAFQTVDLTWYDFVLQVGNGVTDRSNIGGIELYVIGRGANTSLEIDSITAESVPEPGTTGLAGVTLTIMGLASRRVRLRISRKPC